MPKRKVAKRALADHSAKAREGLSNIELSDQAWRAKNGKPSDIGPQETKLRDVLQKAGIKAEDIRDALIDVYLAFGFYKSNREGSVEFPRPSEERQSLEALIERGKSLVEACKYLPPTTRKKLAGPNRRKSTSDPSRIALSVDRLVELATSALTKVEKDKRGRQVDMPLYDLLLAISVLHYKYISTDAGITKRGAATSWKEIGMYRGALLDVATELLRLEGIGSASRDAIGEKLFHLSKTNREWIKRRAKRSDSGTDEDVGAFYALIEDAIEYKRPKKGGRIRPREG